MAKVRNYVFILTCGFLLLGNSFGEDDYEMKDDISELDDVDDDEDSGSFFSERKKTTPKPYYSSKSEGKKSNKKNKKVPLNIIRLEQISDDLKSAYDATLEFKTNIVNNISSSIEDVIHNHSKVEDANTYIFKNRLQNIILRMPGAKAEGCIKGNNHYQGVFKMRKLANLKCVDDASRLVALNRQWTMIDSYHTQIYNHLLQLIRDCKKDRSTYSECFDRSLDTFERLASGAITMKYDFVKYANKVEKKLSKRYYNCYNMIDMLVLTKFVECLKKNKKSKVNTDKDIMEKFKSIQDLTKNHMNYDLDEDLPLDEIPLRRNKQKKIG